MPPLSLYYSLSGALVKIGEEAKARVCTTSEGERVKDVLAEDSRGKVDGVSVASFWEGGSKKGERATVV